MTDLIERLRKMATAVYIAVEEPVAADISDGLIKATEEIEHLRREVRYWHHRYAEVCMGTTSPIDPWANIPENEGFDGPQGAE